MDAMLFIPHLGQWEREKWLRKLTGNTIYICLPQGQHFRL